MPRGDKSSYSGKQKRQAEHIEEGYEKRGTSPREAERRAWATVNKETHGGKLSGSGRGRTENHEPSREGGRKGDVARALPSEAGRPKRGGIPAGASKHSSLHDQLPAVRLPQPLGLR